METAMMIKERIIDRYGFVNRTVGVGGSGGALQQYYAMNGAPACWTAPRRSRASRISVHGDDRGRLRAA